MRSRTAIPLRRGGGILVLLSSALVGLASRQVSAGDEKTLEVPPIVFVSRAFGPAPIADKRTGPIERAIDGRLVLRHPDGSETNLVDATRPGATPETPVDVSDPSVSYDATRIVFSGYSTAESACSDAS